MYRIDKGFQASIGNGGRGWYCAVQVRPNRDDWFTDDPDDRENTDGAQLRPGCSEQKWADTLAEPPELQVCLITPDGKGGAEERTLETADGLWGPVAARCTHAHPVVAWTARDNGQWRLNVHRAGETVTLFESRQVLRNPCVAEWQGNIFTGCVVMTSAGPRIRVFKGDGERILETDGRNPRLEAGRDGVFLLRERAAKGPSWTISVARLPESGQTPKWRKLPRPQDLNLNADLLYDPTASCLYVVHEACGGWGVNEAIGLHRDLYLWRFDERTDEFQAVEHTALGRVPILYEASHSFNRPPIQPRLLVLDGKPAVAFRRFVYIGGRPFSWYYFLTRLTAQGWSVPTRISEHYGMTETDYGVLAVGEGLLAAFSCGKQHPGVSYDDYTEGRQHCPSRVYDHWIDLGIVAADTDFGPPRVLPNHSQGVYRLPLPVRDIAPEPPPVPKSESAGQKTLIWGDLHQHSAWSKCQFMDGSIDEILRFERDILGCRVFSFGEHTTMMSEAEFTWYMDRLEAEAGEDGVALFGCEPWTWGHDTNFYAIERPMFGRLRVLYLRHRHLGVILDAIARGMPPRSIAAIRHFHGPRRDGTRQHARGEFGEQYGTDHPAVGETWFESIEPAMEAMQVRGNVMLERIEGFPAFPVNFLNHGARVGVVGGSDHNHMRGYNHFCLTGFWVNDVSPAGVWDALWNRRTVACANGKVALGLACDGHGMGELLPGTSSERCFTVHGTCARPIRRVTLMYDGELRPWQTVDHTTCAVEFVEPPPSDGCHWYCAVAEADPAPDLQDQPVVAHSSPMFVGH